MKRRIDYINVLLILLIIAGIVIGLSPFIERIYDDYKQEDIVEFFFDQVDKEEIAKLKEKKSEAQAYNEGLAASYNNKQIYTNIEKFSSSYRPDLIASNGVMGVVSLPKINERLPIYPGVSEEQLYKGVGHWPFTSIPIGGKNTHSVLTTHSGIPDKKLFTDLEKMEEGDLLYLENIFGSLVYQVDQIKVVKPNDFSEIAILEDRDLITLLTCTPYGINSHRLLVRASRLELGEGEVGLRVNSMKASQKGLELGLMVLILLIVLINIYRIINYGLMQAYLRK